MRGVKERGRKTKKRRKEERDGFLPWSKRWSPFQLSDTQLPLHTGKNRNREGNMGTDVAVLCVCVCVCACVRVRMCVCVNTHTFITAHRGMREGEGEVRWCHLLGLSECTSLGFSR